jgi:polyhydroxyalkanoate synthesis regulator phasin
MRSGVQLEDRDPTQVVVLPVVTMSASTAEDTRNTDMPTLKEELAALRKEVAELQKTADVPEPILAAKAEFFGRIFASAVGTQGSHAFSDNFLTRLENNSERIWNAYVQITRGDSIKLSEERVEDAKKETADANERLKRALQTIAAQNATIADLSNIPAEDDLPEEAAVEDIPKDD